MKITGDLIITKENQGDYSEVSEVSGSVYVRQGATFTAPVLAKSGSVYVRQGATFTAPVLAEVSGSVDVQEGATFTAPVLAERYRSLGYKIEGNSFSKGVYIDITEKEKGYLERLKPIIKSNKLVMSTWHENENWKNQTFDQVFECGTTHCVAGWIQIFEKDKYNEISAEECGKICAPNLAVLFYKSEQEVEEVINTLLPE